MRTKINWGYVFMAWLMLEMIGIIMILPGPAVSLMISVLY